MSAGTLTLTNNSAQVSGVGTTFNIELAAGDFIVVTVGGIPYTLPVKSIESETSLTLVSNFTGPTQAGGAWSAVPRVAMNLITAAVVTQAAEALRGLNYDKQNWQQVFSASGNISVKLPDDSTFTGPSWASIITSLNSKADSDNFDVFKQLADQTVVYGPRPDKKIAFRINATEWGCVVTNSGTPVPLGEDFGGTGARKGDYWSACSNIGAIRPKTQRFGTGDTPTDLHWKNATGFMAGQVNDGLIGAWIDITSYDNSARMQIIGHYGAGHGQAVGMAYQIFDPNSQQWMFGRLKDNRNTTIDTNGFLKAASPIVKLNGDGTAELNDEAQGATVERISTGVYKVSGVLGFNSDPVWGGSDGGFVIPQNNNGLPLLWVDYDIDADGSITLKTFHRTHPSAPAFAQNLIEAVKDGDPVDIPTGRWIDLRVEMPESALANEQVSA